MLTAQLLVVWMVARAGAITSPYQSGPGLYPRFDSKKAEPGLRYGRPDALPLPRTLLYCVTPDELLADGDAWARRGFGGFFLNAGVSEWSADIWAADGEPWTTGPSDRTLRKVRAGAELCRRLDCELFLTISFGRFFEWFDDMAWLKAEHCFEQYAAFAREAGCTGLAIDIEYIWPQYHFCWPEYDYNGYSRKDLVEMVRRRMTGVARVLYKAFPDMVLLTLPEGALNLGGHIQAAWVEEAARRNAPGGIHFCMEYTYRRPNIRYMFGQGWLVTRILGESLSDAGNAYLHARCGLAAGLWPFGDDPDDYHGAAPSPGEFRQAFAASLMMSNRYNWVYSHTFRPLMLGRDAQGADPHAAARVMEVIRARDAVTTPRYVRAAQSLRRMQPGDPGAALGLTVAPAFAGPREELELSLMPAAVFRPPTNAPDDGRLWTLGIRAYRGEEVDFHAEFGVQTRWLVLGPFDNTDMAGFDRPYPPEDALDLDREYEVVNGTAKWRETECEPKRASVDLAKMFTDTEHVCAYALCYVACDQPRRVQARFGANDGGKLWVGGRLVRAVRGPGRIILDRDIVDISLPAGITPILLKVCNNQKDWGFIFRITDKRGAPVSGLTFSTRPEPKQP